MITPTGFKKEIGIFAKPAGQLLLIAALAFIVYAGSLSGQFVWDDHALITDNPYVKDCKYLPRVFSQDLGRGAGVEFHYWRPLVSLVQMLEYSWWGSNPVGYHLASISFHALAAFCLYWLIMVLFSDALIAFLAAGLFVVHPVHSATAASISGLVNSLAAVFILLSVIFYVKYCRGLSAGRHGGDQGHYLLMLVSFALALISKENSLVVPGLFLLYHFVFRVEAKMKSYVPILAVVLGYLVWRNTVLIHSLVQAAGIFARLPAFLAALTGYAGLLLLPRDIHMEYAAQDFSWADPAVIAGALILAGLLAAAFWRKQKIIAWAAGWFLLTLLPVSNIFSTTAFYMTGHYLYLPAAGFFLVLAAGLARSWRSARWRVYGVGLAFTLVAVYSCLAAGQNVYWSDDITFFRHNLKYAARSARMHYNLGLAYYQAGDKRRAIDAYQQALTIEPASPAIYYNLALAYSDTGQADLAITDYKKAIQLEPRYFQAYNGLGYLCARLGRDQEAEYLFQTAMAIAPDFSPARDNLIALYRRNGRPDLAARYTGAKAQTGRVSGPGAGL